MAQVYAQHAGAPMRTRYDRTYQVIGLLAGDGSLHTLHTCKTKQTAVKYAHKALATLLYSDVTINCLVIAKPVYN